MSRPFLSIRFDCCRTFARIYLAKDGKRYAGHCPKCARPVTIRVGPGGSDCRTFVVR